MAVSEIDGRADGGRPLALAAVTMVVTGCRPGEVLASRSRDVNDGGTILHVRGTKTKAAKRSIPIDPAFQPILMGAALGKESDALLFDFQPERERANKDARARRSVMRFLGACARSARRPACNGWSPTRSGA